MRISEILQPAHTFDVIKFPIISEIGKFYDKVIAKTQNFLRPAWDVDIETLVEWQSIIEQLLAEIGDTQLPAEWMQKIQKLDYFLR